MPVTEESLGKVVEEIRMLADRSIKMAQEKAALIREQCDDKVRELERQNDGLLGTVGRLQADRDQMAKKLADKENLERQRENDIRLKVMELDRRQENNIRQYDEEIAGYKKHIADLEAKLKKQQQGKK